MREIYEMNSEGAEKLKGKEGEKNRSQAAADSPIQVACLRTLRPVEPVLRELGMASPTTPDYLQDSVGSPGIWWKQQDSSRTG